VIIITFLCYALLQVQVIESIHGPMDFGSHYYLDNLTRFQTINLPIDKFIIIIFNHYVEPIAYANAIINWSYNNYYTIFTQTGVYYNW
jgi:hypothetical protein